MPIPESQTRGGDHKSELDQNDAGQETLNPKLQTLNPGQEEATTNLNWMNTMPAKKPWALTFSYGRALQQSCLQTWLGKDQNIELAQQNFLHRAKSNADAQLGKYKASEHANGAGGGGQDGGNKSKSLYEKDYRY